MSEVVPIWDSGRGGTTEYSAQYAACRVSCMKQVSFLLTHPISLGLVSYPAAYLFPPLIRNIRKSLWSSDPNNHFLLCKTLHANGDFSLPCEAVGRT